MGSDLLGAGDRAADLAADRRLHLARGPRPHRAEAVARAALRRAVLAMDRILRLARPHGDGRHLAGVAGAIAAAVRDLRAGRLLQWRDHHAANRAVRRRRGRNGGDLDPHAAKRGADRDRLAALTPETE